MKHPKKPYTFSKTISSVADVIKKVRSMKNLSAKEELVYLMRVRNLSKAAAEKIIESRPKIDKVV